MQKDFAESQDAICFTRHRGMKNTMTNTEKLNFEIERIQVISEPRVIPHQLPSQFVTSNSQILTINYDPSDVKKESDEKEELC